MFVIEGNIGSGKTTLCSILERELRDDANVHYEPVDLWTSIKDTYSGMSILDEFYNDQQRWSYSMQSITFLTRFMKMSRMNSWQTCGKVDLLERSIFSDKNVFAKSLYDSGKMKDLEWQWYNKWFDQVINMHPESAWKPEGFIYIRADPSMSFSRMQKRNRGAESGVPIEYLDVLHRYHESFLSDKNEIFGRPVLVIDGNREFKDDLTYQAEIVYKVKNFVNQNKIYSNSSQSKSFY